MHKKFIFLFIVLLLTHVDCHGQAISADTAKIQSWLYGHINKLADTAMHGRGYVKNGRVLAADYLKKEFKKEGLKPLGRKKSYAQRYNFPVNTFPGQMDLVINGKALEVGSDYIVDASSHSFSGVGLTIEKRDLSVVKGDKDWQQMVKSLGQHGKIFYLENVDSACKQLGIRKHYLPYVLPKGCYLIPQKEKFIWTVECEQANGTVFYVHKDALPTDIKSVDVHLQAKFLNEAKSDNLIGMLTGEVKDTFIAVTAHYDHLGMMGTKATFPGASDNASGTAMLLYLAHYFSTHPHHYSILFISFSGEEPGLLGSEYFIRHPRVPLKNIKFLTNIDIMGDASEGITVVNATEYPAQFALMQKINADSSYIPQVKSRGKASNSDHYYFSEKGVPSFFIYSNGGRGYYHDIFDKPEAVTLNHIGGAARLLIDFMMQIK